MSKFWDKFWTKIENFFEPLGKFFDKIEDKTLPILVPVMTVIADLVVLYSIYFIIKEPSISWLWSLLVALVTFPILYYFNRYGFEFCKKWFKKDK